MTTPDEFRQMTNAELAEYIRGYGIEDPEEPEVREILYRLLTGIESMPARIEHEMFVKEVQKWRSLLEELVEKCDDKAGYTDLVDTLNRCRGELRGNDQTQQPHRA